MLYQIPDFIKHTCSSSVLYLINYKSTDCVCFKWLKNDLSVEFIGEVILKINVV